MLIDSVMTHQAEAEAIITFNLQHTYGPVVLILQHHDEVFQAHETGADVNEQKQTETKEDVKTLEASKSESEGDKYLKKPKSKKVNETSKVLRTHLLHQGYTLSGQIPPGEEGTE